MSLYMIYIMHVIVLKKKNVLYAYEKKNGDVYTLYTTGKKTCIYIIYKWKKLILIGISLE